MNSFSIALNNFRHNLKAYGLHLAAMVFSVAVYYNFMTLIYNPETLQLASKSVYVSSASAAVSFILLVFLVFFIWFSSSFFLNQRKKEIGIYAFMGVRNSQVGFIFALEGLLTGMTAIAAGLFFGVLFGKLFMMLLAKAALLNVTVGFVFSWKGFVRTAITFMVLFSLTSAMNFFEVAKSKLIDLFNAAKKEEELSKVNYIKAVLSILIIGVGYYYVNYSLDEMIMIRALVTVILVVWGTFWLFDAFLNYIMKVIVNAKSVLYKGVNIVSLSTIAFRVKKNYRTLAIIAVLVATTTTAFGTVTSLKYYVGKNHDIELPYSFTFISEDQGYKDKVKAVIDLSDHNILFDNQIKLLQVREFETEFRYFSKEIHVISFSDFERSARRLNKDGGQSILSQVKPEKGEGFLVSNSTTIASLDRPGGKTIKIGERSYVVRDELRTPLFGNGYSKYCLILHDEEYEALKPSYNQVTFNGIIVDRQEESHELARQLHELEPQNKTMYYYVGRFENKYDFIGVVYFLGAFLSLVFVIATGSIIYFKLLSEALEDKGKYEILKRVGMSREEISKAASRQIGISFLLPLMVGSVHGAVALHVLSQIMNYGLLVPGLVTFGAFAAIYGIYYIATVKKFVNLVTGA